MEVGVKMESLISRGLKLFKNSTPSQTSWAIMGLLAAGQLDSKEVERWYKIFVKNNLDWKEEHFTAVGFPKVFYLKYHGYANYFPLLNNIQN